LSERAIDESLKLRYAIAEKIRTTVKRNLDKIRHVPVVCCRLSSVFDVMLCLFRRPYQDLPREKWPQELLGLFFSKEERNTLSVCVLCMSLVHLPRQAHHCSSRCIQDHAFQFCYDVLAAAKYCGCVNATWPRVGFVRRWKRYPFL